MLGGMNETNKTLILGMEVLFVGLWVVLSQFRVGDVVLVMVIVVAAFVVVLGGCGRGCGTGGGSVRGYGGIGSSYL